MVIMTTIAMVVVTMETSIRKTFIITLMDTILFLYIVMNHDLETNLIMVTKTYVTR